MPHSRKCSADFPRFSPRLGTRDPWRRHTFQPRSGGAGTDPGMQFAGIREATYAMRDGPGGIPGGRFQHQRQRAHEERCAALLSLERGRRPHSRLDIGLSGEDDADRAPDERSGPKNGGTTIACAVGGAARGRIPPRRFVRDSCRYRA